MPKGEFLSSYQKGIVRRYYANLDTIALQKLAEAVSELYVCTDEKKAARLWAGVAKALPKVVEHQPTIDRILAVKDVKLLAEVVGEAGGRKN